MLRGALGTPILFEHPRAGGHDPFDADCADPQWFMNASGYTYATTDWNALNDWEAVGAAIPMGYRVIACHQKLAVIQGGVVLREWEELAPRGAITPLAGWTEGDRYQIFLQDLGLPYRRKFDPSGGTPFSLAIPRWAWSTRRLDHALALSRAVAGRVMVTRHLYTEDWH